MTKKEFVINLIRHDFYWDENCHPARRWEHRCMHSDLCKQANSDPESRIIYDIAYKYNKQRPIQKETAEEWVQVIRDALQVGDEVASVEKFYDNWVAKVRWDMVNE